MNKETFCYWDTSVFIHLLQEESMSSDAEMRKGAGEIWDSVQDGGCKIITSVITLVEIKGKHIKHNLEQYKKFLRCCEDGGVLLIALNRRIAEKASEARFYSWPNEKNLKTEDSIHLATAMTAEPLTQILYCTDGDLLKLDPTKLIKLRAQVGSKKPNPSKLF